MLRRKRARPSYDFHGIVSFAIMDTLAYVASFLSLFLTLDQVRIVWINHNVSGVSLIAWAGYALSSAVWLAYGYMHKDRVLLITNILWVVMSALIVLGIFMY
jgi:uncharacterized protein with PQ loop repeat